MIPINVYIGYDRNLGDAAYKVCRESLLDHSSVSVNVVKMDQSWLRRIGLYRRQFFLDGRQYYDCLDGKPFSTEFSFSRFLVPSLQPEGWAIWCDSDFLFRADVYELAALQNDSYAAMCVKHNFEPERGTKMEGQIQEPYLRKNWSSLMMWNCGNPSTRLLTPYMVNTMPGSWLHQLRWLKDEEIGQIPEEWNWLDGHSPEDLEPKAVHYTRGTPDMGSPWDETLYAHEWLGTWAGIK